MTETDELEHRVLVGHSPYLVAIAVVMVALNVFWLAYLAPLSATWVNMIVVFAGLGAASGFFVQGGARSRVDVYADAIVFTNMFRVVRIDREAIEGLQTASGIYVVLKSGRAMTPTSFSPALGKRMSSNARARRFGEQTAGVLGVDPHVSNPLHSRAVPKESVRWRVRGSTIYAMVGSSVISCAIGIAIHIIV